MRAIARRTTRLLGCLLLVAATACDTFAPDGPPEEQLLDGTIEGMPGSQLRQHLVGDEEFGRRFTVEDGLGPVFVATACEQCHVGDGKGHPVFNLTRFGTLGVNGFDPLTQLGGPQLQHRSIPGYPPETVPGEATGGSGFTTPPGMASAAGCNCIRPPSSSRLCSRSQPSRLCRSRMARLWTDSISAASGRRRSR